MAVFLTIIFAWSIQLVMVVGRWLPSGSLSPAFRKDLLNEGQALFVPEHEVGLFILMIISIIGLTWTGISRWNNKITSAGFCRRWIAFAAVECLFVFLMAEAQFKMIVYSPSIWARTAFDVLCILCILYKISHKSLASWFTDVLTFLQTPRNVIPVRIITDLVFAGLIFAMIYMPYPEAVTARMFFGEQFHHNDSFIMGPAWAYLSGNVLDVDTISQYGLGMPVILAHLSKIFGGFSYESILKVMMWITILYYLGWYGLLRKWISNPLLSLAAVMTAIKMQMHHTGVYPMVFTYGSTTVIRYCFDIIVLWALFMHLRTYDRRWLIAAAAFCGVQLFHIPPEGIYLTGTLFFYFLAQIVIPHMRKSFISSRWDWLRLGGCMCLPFVTSAALLFSTHGIQMFSPEFRHNSTEFIQYFLNWFGLMPMTESLKYRNCWANLMGLVIPAVYVFTLIFIGALVWLKKIRREHFFAAVVVIYGLGINHYYIARSAVTSYYTTAVPYAAILMFWASHALQYAAKTQRLKFSMGFLFVCAYALFTNHSFLSYPNLLCLSRNPITDPQIAQPLPNRKPYFNHLFYEYPDAYKLPKNSLGTTDEGLREEYDFASDDELVAAYRKESDFSEDAALIDEFIPEGGKVALVSGFDVKILMQANRRPFFYYYPIVVTRPMAMRMFVVACLYTTDQLKKTIEDMKAAGLQYVFVETIFLNRDVPQAYYYDSPAFMGLINHVLDNYEPVKKGKYLTALKFKGSRQ